MGFYSELVRLTLFVGFPGVGAATVMPLLSIWVAPVFTLPLLPKSMFWASLILSVLVAASATTPMLPSVRVPVAPPFTFRVEPSLRSTLVPLSPAKVRGLMTSAFRYALKTNRNLGRSNKKSKKVIEEVEEQVPTDESNQN